ncbi:MAG: ferrochelatase [Myxococcota bacterium]|nr:ferrochelatase [Myxococcota bacterium]
MTATPEETKKPIGVLLVNVGPPDAPESGPVRRYLRQFLNDPRVIDLNPIGRWLLLNLVILPFRPKKSAEAYRQIWTDEGSPLLVNSRAMADRLNTVLGDDFHVELGMRYGNPSIDSALSHMKALAIDEIVIFPLYPQYAASSTGTSLEYIFKRAGEMWNVPNLYVVPPFYDDPGTIAACAEVAEDYLFQPPPDHVLFSFHGLPERHMLKSDETGEHCLKEDGCCQVLCEANRNCYKAQCYATAGLVAAELNLADGDWSVAFQSRLGTTPWIQPYTDEVIPQLANDGVRTITVVCASFVADCLETLEEIGMRAEEDFKALGGESLSLVPALNAHPTWIRAAADQVKRVAPRSSSGEDESPEAGEAQAEEVPVAAQA